MESFGGPEVLHLAEVPDPEPRGSQVLINVTRAGVNYADIHVRSNTYLADISAPFIPGNEVVGQTPEGRRVVALSRGGGYAEKVVVHKKTVWEIPDGITDEQAAPIALQGNSAWHLIFNVLHLEAGEKVVIPAAAGGVGSIAVQLASQAGAKVIALASTEEKRNLALELGASAVVDSSSSEDLGARIEEAARGKVHAALEMTGGPTCDHTLNTLAPLGRMAVYGYASGELPKQLPLQTMLERSITVSGFWLPNLYAGRNVFLDYSTPTLFAMISNGSLRTISGGTYALGDAAQAHRDLASRSVIGKLSLDTGQ
ncbi:zinc-binding alcohol dehydrogenase family protein [Streptomyces sp. NPDC051546]|uniref:zinc-binding alcohol dehydrogenase family protein n=1 Tax=Streptomyces sp. NPDC051546 TaxID=3365655 RepID=UPI0037AD445F